MWENFTLNTGEIWSHMTRQVRYNMWENFKWFHIHEMNTKTCLQLHNIAIILYNKYIHGQYIDYPDCSQYGIAANAAMIA